MVLIDLYKAVYTILLQGIMNMRVTMITHTMIMVIITILNWNMVTMEMDIMECLDLIWAAVEWAVEEWVEWVEKMMGL